MLAAKIAVVWLACVGLFLVEIRFPATSRPLVLGSAFAGGLVTGYLIWGQKRGLANDALDCPKGQHEYELPRIYPPGVPPPGTPGVIFIRDCHCQAASPGHTHWARLA